MVPLGNLFGAPWGLVAALWSFLAASSGLLRGCAAEGAVANTEGEPCRRAAEDVAAASRNAFIVTHSSTCARLRSYSLGSAVLLVY